MGLLASILSSCTSIGLKAINGLAKSDGYKLFADIEYGQDVANKLDVYLPSDQPATATVIFFYGGCWGHCLMLLLIGGIISTETVNFGIFYICIHISRIVNIQINRTLKL